MKIKIRHTRYDDIPRLMEIYNDARQIMYDSGNLNQWDESYPSEETIRDDISKNISYVIDNEGIIVGTFMFIEGPDATYAQIFEGEWPNDNPYFVIHRLAAAKSIRKNISESNKSVAHSGKGIAEICFNWAMTRTKTLRIDTHKDNVIMHHILRKYGFKYCGIIYLANGDPRDAYILER